GNSNADQSPEVKDLKSVTMKEGIRYCQDSTHWSRQKSPWGRIGEHRRCTAAGNAFGSAWVCGEAHHRRCSCIEKRKLGPSGDANRSGEGGNQTKAAKQ